MTLRVTSTTNGSRQLGGDALSYIFKRGIIAFTRLVIGVNPTTDLITSRQSHYIPLHLSKIIEKVRQSVIPSSGSRCLMNPH